MAIVNSDFVTKVDKRYFLFPLIVSTIPIIGVTYHFLKNPRHEIADFHETPIGLTIAFLFMLFLFAFFCYRYFFDSNEKLRIDNEGIRTQKYGATNWDTIWYIYLKKIKGKITQKILHIKLTTEDKELKIDISYLDKPEDEILDALKSFSKDYNIQFLDKNIQNP